LSIFFFIPSQNRNLLDELDVLLFHCQVCNRLYRLTNLSIFAKCHLRLQFIVILGLELLEAQAATGCILDPITGDRYDSKGALERDLIDATQMDAIERAMRAVTGYRDPVTGQTLSLFEVSR